jgi:hypothetical protein
MLSAADLILTAMRLMSSLLFETSPADPSTCATMSLTLIAVTVLASYVPAARATAVDPIEALRSEQAIVRRRVCRRKIFQMALSFSLTRAQPDLGTGERQRRKKLAVRHFGDAFGEPADGCRTVERSKLIAGGVSLKRMMRAYRLAAHRHPTCDRLTTTKGENKAFCHGNLHSRRDRPGSGPIGTCC